MNAPPEAGKYRRLLTICLAEMGTMLVFLNYSAVLPLLQAEWHLSSTEAGLIYSAYQMTPLKRGVLSPDYGEIVV